MPILTATLFVNNSPHYLLQSEEKQDEQDKKTAVPYSVIEQRRILHKMASDYFPFELGLEFTPPASEHLKIVSVTAGTDMPPPPNPSTSRTPFAGIGKKPIAKDPPPPPPPAVVQKPLITPPITAKAVRDIAIAETKRRKTRQIVDLAAAVQKQNRQTAPPAPTQDEVRLT